jgi:signal transduction histidine kinase
MRRHRAEVEARRRLTQLAHLNRTATAGALSASIAHELNQPLGAILSNTEAAELLLENGRLDPATLGEILTDIRRADQRASDIIKRLRTLLKQGELERRPVDLNGIIEDTVAILRAPAALRQIALNWQSGAGITVDADPVHIQQVLLNLATNAMDAMPGTAGMRQITFRTASPNDAWIEVSVADTGTGIPDPKLNSVFEPFFTTKREGLGLGLSIVRTIVETYGGKIWAENRKEGGAVFRFTLPLARKAAA